MTDTIPVTFRNKDNARMFGVLHRPSGGGVLPPGIVILSPGIKSRVAPHRMYVKMARRFSEMGFPVLRFDYSGLGDSEGEISERYVADFYGSVQVGRYVNDTVCAMDWMEGEYGLQEFILAGLCGGAITGLLTGAGDRRVSGLLGLGIPVILDSSTVQHDRYITEGQLEAVMKGRYARNLVRWESWLRFLTFRSDYRLIMKGLWQIMSKRMPGRTRRPRPGGERAGTGQEPGNFNPHFPGALKKMLSTERQVYFIFSEADRLYLEFLEKYLARYRNDIEEHSANLKFDVAVNANHIFSFQEWQDDMLEKSCAWLAAQRGKVAPR